MCNCQFDVVWVRRIVLSKVLVFEMRVWRTEYRRKGRNAKPDKDFLEGFLVPPFLSLWNLISSSVTNHHPWGFRLKTVLEATMQKHL